MQVKPSDNYTVMFDAKSYGTFDDVKQAIALAKRMIVRRKTYTIGSIYLNDVVCVGVVTDDANGVQYRSISE